MAVCGVCSKALAEGERIFRCDKCGVLHHLDCWKYFGSCAVYGCDSTSYK